MTGENVGVLGACHGVFRHAAEKGQPQVLPVGCDHQRIQAEQGGGGEGDAGFLTRFADHGVERMLAGFDVTGGLVQHRTGAGIVDFLNEQEMFASADHRCDCQIPHVKTPQFLARRLLVRAVRAHVAFGELCARAGGLSAECAASATSAGRSIQARP